MIYLIKTPKIKTFMYMRYKPNLTPMNFFGCKLKLQGNFTKFYIIFFSDVINCTKKYLKSYEKKPDFFTKYGTNY